MFYKNLAIYRFPANYSLAPAALNFALAKMPSRHPAELEEFTMGFVPPVQTLFAEQLPNRAIAICLEKIEKIIPAAAVKDLLAKRIDEIETKENRKLPNKERTLLKDEIILSILPTALTKATRTHAYLDFVNRIIVVDSSSAKRAEELLSHLRKALGSLPVTPLSSEIFPETLMTNWVSRAQPSPDYFNLESELQLTGIESGKITLKDVDPETEEVRAHLDFGMQVTKLGLTFEDRLSFVLTDTLQFKKLKFLDLVQADLNSQLNSVSGFDQVSDFQVTAMIQAAEIRKLLDALNEELLFRIPDLLPEEPAQQNEQPEEEELA